MPIKCNEPVALSFNNTCLNNKSISICSQYLTGAKGSSLNFDNFSSSSPYSTFWIVLYSKETNREVQSLTNRSIEQLTSYDFNFENYNYQIRALNSEFLTGSINYSECYEVKGLESIYVQFEEGSHSFFDTTIDLVPLLIIIISFSIAIYWLSGLIRNSGKGRL